MKYRIYVYTIKVFVTPLLRNQCCRESPRIQQRLHNIAPLCRTAANIIRLHIKCCRYHYQTMGDDVIELSPFLHQLGGHCGLYQFNETTICKPVTQRELSFYQSMPDKLKPFSPQYRGTVDVQCLEDPSGYVSIIAHHNPSLGTLSPSTAPKAKLRVRNAGGVDLELPPTNQSTNGHTGTDKVLPNNPWSGNIHSRQLAKVKQEKQRCILLENLTNKYKYPCMLDLKMGTRNFGDDFSESKKLFHIKRCETTTSSTLGLRICGMQVFNLSTGSYLHLDKYKGRTFDHDGVRQCLRNFLQNGTQLRQDVIASIVRRLQEVYDTILNLSSLRLYGTSLLIMYDGGVQTVQNTNSKPPSCDSKPPSCDSKPPSCDSKPPSCGSHDSERNSTPVPDLVDIRIIDFSKSTFQGFCGDCFVHEGPDDGYLFGLRNLIAIFENVLDKRNNGAKNEEVIMTSLDTDDHVVLVDVI